jgi:hypothetical protein
MPEHEIPDVDQTDLTREELEEVAEEVGVDADGLDDQELLEQLGVALGAIDEQQDDDSDERASDEDGESEGEGEDADEDGEGEDGDEDGEGEDGDGQAAAAEDDATQDADEDDATQDADEDDESEDEADEGDADGRLAGLRARIASRLDGAADRIRPGGHDDGSSDEGAEARDEEDDDGGDDGGDDDRDDREDRDDSGEQRAVGEPIEGPTRDELRAQLAELGLPVSGTKDELARRLTEAQQTAEDEDQDGEAEEQDGGEQRAVGEPIEGPTRDELRAQLKELDLPVSGTKEELAQRLAEAQQEGEGDADRATEAPGGSGDEAGEAASSDGEEPPSSLRGKAAKALAKASEKLGPETPDAADEGDGDGGDGDESDGDEGDGDEGDGDGGDGGEEDRGPSGIRERVGRTLISLGERVQGQRPERDGQPDAEPDGPGDQPDDATGDDDASGRKRTGLISLPKRAVSSLRGKLSR